MDTITFTKVKLPNGWLGNMSPSSIVWAGERWATSEALFQALRFDDQEIQRIIRNARSPMTAKMLAKKHKSAMTVTPLSEVDQDHMRFCLLLKFSQNYDLRGRLMATGDATIIEDVTKRGNRGTNLFWGAKLENGVWVGQNMLGKMLMDLRRTLILQTSYSSAILTAIMPELMAKVNTLAVTRDVHIMPKLIGTQLSVCIMAGYGEAASEHNKTVDINDPNSIGEMQTWLADTVMTIYCQ